MTDSLFARIRNEIGKIPVIDSHEHLPNESDRLAQPVDFFTLFSHYVSGDLGGAGAPPNLATQLNSPGLTPAQKWTLFAPYYDRLADGSYARAAHIAIKKFYDMDRLTSAADAEMLTERVRAANTPGLYRRVLRDACNIITSLNFVGMGAVDREFFIPVLFITHLSEINQIASFAPWRRRLDAPSHPFHAMWMARVSG